MTQALLAAAEARRDWAVGFLEELAHLESPSTDKAALDRCGLALDRRLTELGARVERVPQPDAGDHLRAEFGSGEAQVLLLGHFDTVWPVGQIAQMPVERREGRLYGPGVFDMKAGIVIGALALRALHDTGQHVPHRVVMLLTSDEETGSLTSRTLIEQEASRSRAVLVLEPSLPDGAVKTARKGVGEYVVTVEGVAAHAGIEPERGASAIHEIAWQICELLTLHDPVAGLTLNVGAIEGGGRTNVVADRASAAIDVRVSTLHDAQRVATAMAQLTPRDARVRLTVRGGINRPPLERSPQVVGLYETARQVAAELGLALGEGSTGGGSDGNFTAALGVPTLDGLGAIGDGAHALHEHVELQPLPLRAALLAGLLLRLQ